MSSLKMVTERSRRTDKIWVIQNWSKISSNIRFNVPIGLNELAVKKSWSKTVKNLKLFEPNVKLDASTNRRSVTNEQKDDQIPKASFLNLGFAEGF